MGQTIVKIEGTITNVSIWQPKEGQKGRPNLRIDLLQITGEGSNIETIKDDDLNTKYVIGQAVVLECTASPWSFEKKSGVSFKVFRGSTKTVSLNVDSEYDAIAPGKDSDEFE